MREFRALTAVCLLALLACGLDAVLRPVPAAATPRNGNPSVQLTARQDGDTRSGIYVALSSQSWTEIVPERDNRRKFRVEIGTSVVYDVCLATHSASTIGCPAAPGGVILKALVGANVYEDSNGAAVYGRISAGNGATGITATGFDLYDSGD